MPILAQYSVRSKQSYIFRTNEMVEITGASDIIAKLFEKLFPSDAPKRKRVEGEFSLEETRRAFESGELDAVELFCGGGDDTILFKDHEAFKEANRQYTRYILAHYPGLIPLCVGVEAECHSYKEDKAALNAAVIRAKNAMPTGRIENAQPFARVDRTTLQPIYTVVLHGPEPPEYRTREAEEKYQVGLEKVETETKFIDKISKDDKQNLLAIVHADGNNMGEKIRTMLLQEDYDFCVNKMRQFCATVNEVYLEKGKAALEKRLSELPGEYPKEDKEHFRVRWLITGGDDITFICNAKFALTLTEAYLKGVYAANPAFSASAGICVFHGHYPFARAYDLAEDACKSAKKQGRESKQEQAWIDFHYLRSGVMGDLEHLRKLHRTENRMGRPWFVCGEGKEEHSLEKLYELNKILHEKKVVRGQIKTFGDEYEVSEHAGEVVWKRILYNAKGLDKEASAVFGEKVKLYPALYDLGDFYELWFEKEDKDGNPQA